MNLIKSIIFFSFFFFSINSNSQTTVTEVSSTKANGSYKSGDQIPITVTASLKVTVTGI